MNRLEIFQKVYGADHVFTIQELERLRQVTELIVRECVSMAKGFEFAIEQNGFMNPSRYGLSKAMQEHFGIK